MCFRHLLFLSTTRSRLSCRSQKESPLVVHLLLTHQKRADEHGSSIRTIFVMLPIVNSCSIWGLGEVVIYSNSTAANHPAWIEINYATTNQCRFVNNHIVLRWMKLLKRRKVALLQLPGNLKSPDCPLLDHSNSIQQK